MSTFPPHNYFRSSAVNATDFKPSCGCLKPQLAWDFWDTALPSPQNNSSSAADSCENPALLSHAQRCVMVRKAELNLQRFPSVCGDILGLTREENLKVTVASSHLVQSSDTPAQFCYGCKVRLGIAHTTLIQA